MCSVIDTAAVSGAVSDGYLIPSKQLSIGTLETQAASKFISTGRPVLFLLSASPWPHHVVFDGLGVILCGGTRRLAEVLHVGVRKVVYSGRSTGVAQQRPVPGESATGDG